MYTVSILQSSNNTARFELAKHVPSVSLGHHEPVGNVLRSVWRFDGFNPAD